jgi:predicted branched-subunit amino acid permease
MVQRCGWLGGLPIGRAALSLFFLVDGSFVLSAQKARGMDDGALLLGSGVVSYAGWWWRP